MRKFVRKRLPPQVSESDFLVGWEVSKKSMPEAQRKRRDEFLTKLSADPRFKEAPKSGQAYIIVGHKPPSKA